MLLGFEVVVELFPCFLRCTLLLTQQLELLLESLNISTFDFEFPLSFKQLLLCCIQVLSELLHLLN